MKKLFLFAIIAGFVFSACGSKKEEKKNEDGDAYSDYETAEPAKTSLKDLIAQGEALINASDCKTCHTVENRIVGPSYNDVAGKYSFTKENVAFLSEKVITGGAGNWGDIPMTAHVDLSKQDSEKMVYYILSLDGEDYQE
jgi:cytochrome c